MYPLQGEVHVLIFWALRETFTIKIHAFKYLPNFKAQEKNGDFQSNKKFCPELAFMSQAKIDIWTIVQGTKYYFKV
jgi:hypothetical protein